MLISPNNGNLQKAVLIPPHYVEAGTFCLWALRTALQTDLPHRLPHTVLELVPKTKKDLPISTSNTSINFGQSSLTFNDHQPSMTIGAIKQLHKHPVPEWELH